METAQNRMEATENIEEVDNLEAYENTEKFLNFSSDGLLFGINTKYVTEIITIVKPTPLPMVPSYVKGIMNLRGQLIPIVDIRLRLGKYEIEYDEKACIVVIEYEGTSIGIIVDTVVNVVDIAIDNISYMPENNREEMVSGMISLSDKETLLILDCELLLNSSY